MGKIIRNKKKKWKELGKTENNLKEPKNSEINWRKN